MEERIQACKSFGWGDLSDYVILYNLAPNKGFILACEL